MNNNKDISIKKRKTKILPKIKNELNHKRNKENKAEEAILLYKKFSSRISPKSKIKNKKKKKKKLRFMSVGTENKLLKLEENKIDFNRNSGKLKKVNIVNNEYLVKKSFIREMSERKKLFSEKVKLIKIIKRDKSPKPREETSFDLIRKYSLKVLFTNRSAINTKKEKEKEFFEKLEKIDKENNLNELKIKKIRNLPPLLKENFSSNNFQFFEKKHFLSRNRNDIKTKTPHLEPINKRYLMLQYAENINHQFPEKNNNSLNNSNLNSSNNQSYNLINLKRKIINTEKNSNNEKLNHKIKTEFSFKEYNYLNYAIVPGNASYLVKNCMYHRTNWKESFSTVTNTFNFKWQQNTNGINYSKLGSYGNIRQVVNHFENHFAIANKANMFINLMFYCEQRKISVFKYVPLTIIFDLDILNNTLETKYKQKQLEQLKKLVEETASLHIKGYEEIGEYFYDGEFKIENKKRIENIKNRTQRNSFKELFSNSKEEEKYKEENEYSKSLYLLYSDYFGKPELIQRIKTNLENYNYDCYIKNRELEREMSQYLGFKTLIEIPETHSIGKNMWIIKAINLCQGRCMQIAHNFNQMLTILNKFKEGVDFNFTEKILEETQDTEIKNDKKKDKDYSSLYCCDKIIIQKYIERPLLYKGRKCDMRVWVLVTHNMKVYFFKEGHLKTCSVPYNIESKDAYTHITNYSFQKHNSNFQKYEKGNEVPFHDFQKFLDDNYPQRNYTLKIDLYNQIKEIVSISMMSVRDQINKNNRSYQFEIFGYDFMLDDEFNLFLIEINDDPGIEESSPWISIIIPRMLDDALRLTIDQIFYPGYDFSKSYKKNKSKNEEIFKKIKENFIKKIEVKNNNIKTENNVDNYDKEHNKSKERCFTERNFNSDFIKNNNTIENENIYKNYKTNYISPFPVPGYKNDDNLWEFVCDLNGEDPLDKKLDKNLSDENGINKDVKYLFNKKKN